MKQQNWVLKLKNSTLLLRHYLCKSESVSFHSLFVGQENYRNVYIYIDLFLDLKCCHKVWKPTPNPREKPMNCDHWTLRLPTAAPGVALVLEVMGAASTSPTIRWCKLPSNRRMRMGFGGVGDGDILVWTYGCSNTVKLRLQNHENITGFETKGTGIEWFWYSFHFYSCLITRVLSPYHWWNLVDAWNMFQSITLILYPHWKIQFTRRKYVKHSSPQQLWTWILICDDMWYVFFFL